MKTEDHNDDLWVTIQEVDTLNGILVAEFENV